MALWKDPSVKEPSTGLSDAAPAAETGLRSVDRPAPTADAAAENVNPATNSP